MHVLALDYISKSEDMKFEEMGDKKLRQHLTAIQNVMKMVKNIYEGGISQEHKNAIYQKVNQHEQVINVADNLLQNNQNNDDLPIMIVNIIICFNSISNKLDSNRVKTWINNFSARLVDASKAEFSKKSFRQWYMEKYVFIIDLLVTKNLDKVDKEITNDVL